MPAGNITDAERVKRLMEIKPLVDDGLSDNQIAEKTGFALMTVKRQRKYLEELRKADITDEEVAEKRAELWIDLDELAVEAQTIFEKHKMPFQCPLCKGSGLITNKKSKSKNKNEDGQLICSNCKGLGYIHNTKVAKEFLTSMLEIVDRKMKLYGLDQVKSAVTINQQFNQNSFTPDKVPHAVREKISKTLIESHESRAKRKLADDKEME